jgi:alkyl hydroperoxide reductase subunit AhpC
MEDGHGDTGQEAATVGGRRRTVQVKFRVTEDERALIAEKMRLLGTDNLAAYLRKMAIDGYIIKTDHTDIKAMTAEIQKVGVNINQIAKKINTYGSNSVYAEDMARIQEALAEIWRLQRYILSKAR